MSTTYSSSTESRGAAETATYGGFVDALGGSVEARVGVLQDLENGHKSLLIEEIMCRIYCTT